MPVIIKQCPLCNSTNHQMFDQRQFRGQSVANRICESCGLIFQSPRMTEEELVNFYQGEYRQVYQGGREPDPKDLLVQEKRAKALLAFCQVEINKITRHLDIGCSAGLLLYEFQKQYGCAPTGIEPDQRYSDYAKSLGLSVFSSLEELKRARIDLTEQQASRPQRYNLISMAHVLEHLPQPVAYLQSLRTELLAQDGWLLVEVPNLYCHDSFEIAHLVSYSAHTLKETLNIAGFSIDKFQAHGAPRSQTLSLYLTALARPNRNVRKSSPTPERNVKLKRRFGLLKRRIYTKIAPGKAWPKIEA